MTDHDGGPTSKTTLQEWLAFTRPGEGRAILGVAAGLAPRFGLAVWASRGIFVVLGLLGVGVPIYLLLAAISRADDGVREPSRTVLLAAVAVCVVAVFALLGSFGLVTGWVPIGLAALLAIGVLLIVGRGPRSAAQPRAVVAEVPSATEFMGAASVLVEPPAARQTPPPTLLLLSLSGALAAATATWLVVYQHDAVHPVGAVGAAVLVVVGAAQLLGAWRGSSLLLAPLGVLLAIPLALAAFAGVRLEVGTDDPGTLVGDGGSANPVAEYTLGRGAGPVVVGKDVVDGGLETLVLRKAAGTIEVNVDERVPVRVEIATVRRAIVADNVTQTFRTRSRVGRLEADLPGSLPGAPVKRLLLRIEMGNGTARVNHGSPTPSLADPALVEQRIADIRNDLRARRALLIREERLLARQRTAYSSAVAALNTARAVGPGIYALDEGLWTLGPDVPEIAGRDPALRSLSRARELRFNLLRTAWRAANVRRGIAVQQARLRVELRRAERRQP